MSNEENSNEAVDSAAETETTPVVNIVSKLLDLKQSNPKVFFGGIGAVVLIVIVIMMMSGGSKKHILVNEKVNLSIGQSYSLRGVNTYDPVATIRLVAVPGSIAAYDESAEGGDDKCRRMKQGTRVKLLQVQQAFGSAKFVEVEILAGQCAGRKGWASSNNLAN